MQSRTGPQSVVFKHLRAGLDLVCVAAGGILPCGRGGDLGVMPDAEPLHLILMPPDAGGVRWRRYTAATRALFMRAASGPDTSGRGASAAWRWTKNISPRRYATFHSTRCAQASSIARATGAGPVCVHILAVVTTLAPVRERYPDFANFLSEETDAETLARLRGAETIGRPLGTRKFLDMLERKTKRVLKPA
jgi:putative transposase